MSGVEKNNHLDKIFNPYFYKDKWKSKSDERVHKIAHMAITVLTLGLGQKIYNKFNKRNVDHSIKVISHPFQAELNADDNAKQEFEHRIGNINFNMIHHAKIIQIYIKSNGDSSLFDKEIDQMVQNKQINWSQGHLFKRAFQEAKDHLSQ